MKITYFYDIDIRLDFNDITKILNGETLFGIATKHDSKSIRPINVRPSESEFYYGGGLGEGFCDDVFQGWELQRPRVWTQSAFPWGEEAYFTDYKSVNILISKPALIEKIDKGEQYFMGMARGAGSGNTLDRLNLRFNTSQ